MFDTTVFDTLESASRGRRWTTAVSFLLQALAVTVLLLIPLLYTDALPSLHYVEQLTVPAARAPQPTVDIIASDSGRRGSSTSEFRNGVLVAPRRIPNGVTHVVDRPGDFIAAPDPFAVFNSIGSSPQSPAMQRVIATNSAPPEPRPNVRHQPLVVSALSQGALLRRVQPVYPPAARAARIQGPVVLAAVIDTDGRIANLRLLSGNPLLVNAAMDAVKQWRYRPYILNSQAIEVETQITVIFTLN